MKTLTELIYLYGDLFTGEYTAVQLGELILSTEGDNEEFRHGVVELGVCPVKSKKPGVCPVKCWRAAVNGEWRKRERDRLNNMSVAVAHEKKKLKKKGEKAIPLRGEYQTPFPCNGHPYEFQRIKTKREDMPALLRAQANVVKNGGNQKFEG